MSNFTIPAGSELIFQTSDPNISYTMKVSDTEMQFSKSVSTTVLDPVEPFEVKEVLVQKQHGLIINDFSIPV